MTQTIRRSRWHSVPAVMLPAGLTVLLFVLTLFMVVMPTLQSHLLRRKRDMIRELAQTAWAAVADYQRLERTGRFSREEAQHHAIEHLRKMRYGEEQLDYFWIVTTDGIGVLHPHSPEMEGRDLSTLRDSHQSSLYDRIRGAALEKRGGFVEYDWQWHDDPERIVPKISYVRLFAPWGWIIGTGMYIEDVRAEIAMNTRRLTWISLGILGVVTGLSLVIIRTDLRLEDRRRRAERKLRELNAELEQRVAQRTLELSRRNQQLDHTVSELRERERVMAEELQLAQEVQREWLPKAFPFSEELRFAALCRTSLAVGGDLYDAFRVDERTAGFYIADVSGHGVSAALLTATLKVSFDRFRDTLARAPNGSGMGIDGEAFPFSTSASLARFLEDLNNALVDSLPTFSFVTFQMGIIHLDSGRLRLANAGHHPPLCYRDALHQAKPLPVPSNLPLGAAPNWRFRIEEYQLYPGDRLIVHTDGITECQNQDLEEFGQENLIETIEMHGRDSPEALLRSILERTSEFSGNAAPADDQAVLVVDFRAGSAIAALPVG